jgi:short-subunit dehydrogenase
MVTGASTGVGYELARHCASRGFALLVADGDPGIHGAAHALRSLGVPVNPVQGSLATFEGVDALQVAATRRLVDVLVVHAGYDAMGQDLGRLPESEPHIAGAMSLIQQVGRDMAVRGRGAIVISDAIADRVADFVAAMQAELKGSHVTVTCLPPDATGMGFPDAMEPVLARTA